MTRKLIGTALALVLGSGMAFAAAEDVVVVDVDGEMIEVPVELAAEACGLEEAAIEAHVGTGAPACTVDQATADELGIEADAG